MGVCVCVYVCEGEVRVYMCDVCECGRERNALGHVPPPYVVPVRNARNKVDGARQASWEGRCVILQAPGVDVCVWVCGVSLPPSQSVIGGSLSSFCLVRVWGGEGKQPEGERLSDG